MELSKLGLGTAQIGMNYGINNLNGKPSIEESKRIIITAINNGLTTFDTSPKYGDSEKLIGKILANKNKENIKFISKVPPTNWKISRVEIIKNLRSQLDKTLNNLKIKKLPIYLFHRFADIKKKKRILLNELIKLKEEGKIEKIGVSIYTHQEAEQTLDISEIEVVQFPFNLIDKRFIENGFIKKAKKHRIELLARSVFLQGLFFKKGILINLEGFRPYREKLAKLCEEENRTIGEIALMYVSSIMVIDNVLIGVETEKQLLDNIKRVNGGYLSKGLIKEINQMGTAPINIIDPRTWNKK